jgi:hypothetical protein
MRSGYDVKNVLQTPGDPAHLECIGGGDQGGPSWVVRPQVQEVHPEPRPHLGEQQDVHVVQGVHLDKTG